YGLFFFFFFFFQAEDGIRDLIVTGVQTCALPISRTRTMTASMTTTRRTAATSGAPVNEGMSQPPGRARAPGAPFDSLARRGYVYAATLFFFNPRRVLPCSVCISPPKSHA